MQAGDHPPAATGDTSTHCAQPGGPHTQPLQVQRDADRAAALPRTAGACPSGHLDTGRLDTGRLDTGRPLDRLDGRPTAGPDEADRATTDLASVRTSPRRRPPAGRPDLTQVTALGALGHPGRLRGDGTCAGGP